MQLDPKWAWQRNVIDAYKTLSTEDIVEKVKQSQYPLAVLMTNIAGDFNFGSVVRSANALGAAVYYYGNRKWDKRSAVGTFAYTKVNFLPSIEEVRNLKSQYRFVALEQTEKSQSLQKFQWNFSTPNLIVIGEESKGLNEYPEILELMDDFIVIPQVGSVRSLNAAVAGSIAMYDFVSKYNSQ